MLIFYAENIGKQIYNADDIYKFFYNKFNIYNWRKKRNTMSGFDWNGNGQSDAFDNYMYMKIGITQIAIGMITRNKCEIAFPIV